VFFAALCQSARRAAKGLQFEKVWNHRRRTSYRPDTTASSSSITCFYWSVAALTDILQSDRFYARHHTVQTNGGRSYVIFHSPDPGVVDVHKVSFQVAGTPLRLMTGAHNNGRWTTQILQCDQTSCDVSSKLFPWPVHNQFSHGLRH